MYDIIFDPKVIDLLLKLDRSLSKRIWDKIQSTKEDPHRYYERLRGREDYKLRVGDYRVIADIDDNKERIEVTLVGHRKNIYKKIRS